MFFKKNRRKPDTYQDLKEEYCDFDRVESYFQWKQKESSFQNINDHTWSDLDMNEVFMFLDRTHSRPGQQYLYYLLRSIPTIDREEKIEDTIAILKKDKENTEQLVRSLKKLNNRGSYFLHSLFTKEVLKKPKWFWVIYLLFCLTTTTICGFLYYPQLILILLLCLVANFIIHYWNKTRLMEYSNAISQLHHLKKTCKHLSTFQNGIEEKEKFLIARKEINGLTKKSFLLNDNSVSQNEFSVIGDSIIEILKAAFLVEPLMLYHLTHKIEKAKNEIRFLFETVGYLDACISIEAIRISNKHAIPKFSEGRALNAIDCYHPLIDGSVANSINIPENHSILISGSNMSGKTTFIRTIGINALLGQTINTVFASEWSMPKSRIFSAIRISDDLLNDVSFYQKEVQVIKEMIEECKKEEMSLFLIDELYKGTNSIERIAAGASVLSYLNNGRSMVCASTHDLELTELLSDYHNYHFTEQVGEAGIKFDYLLHPDKLQNTNAIRILESNGYPVEVTNQARKIVSELAKK